MWESEIRSSVEKELNWEPSLNPCGIRVAVLDGVVTLSGDVPTYPQKHQAERAAGRVRDVKALVDHLEVKVRAVCRRKDEEIARAAYSAILSNTELPAGSVKISVENGRVKLGGIVDYQFQRHSAHRSVRYLRGVKDVNNHIVVKPRADRELVRADIEAAFLRSADLAAHRIRVETRGDRVILEGMIQTWRQREEAERVAWASPGVSHVENKIVVDPAVALAQSA